MKVNTNNIIYVETIKHNTLVHLRGNNYVCTQTMKEMCNLLENEGFFKCHQSYLVNLDDVESYDTQDIYLKNGETIMLSKRNKKLLKRNTLNIRFNVLTSNSSITGQIIHKIIFNIVEKKVLCVYNY